MKSISTFFILAILLTFSSCIKDACEAERIYTVYDPVYLTPEDLRSGVAVDAARNLEQPGKIYVYGDYLFINEYEEGIHIFNNKNPENPQAISFITIPGNVDMAVRNGYLYADSYVDLLTIDIRNPEDPVFLARQEEIFPRFGFDAERGYIVRYEEGEERMSVPCSETDEPSFWRDGRVWVDVAFDNSGAGTPSPNPVGVGGSLARFTLASDHLYIVNEYDLQAFMLEDPVNPERTSILNLGWGIETIFPYGKNLFIGARNGMHIVDIARPSDPRYASTFWHTNACDPVYIAGNTAYVTLRDGTECETFTNQLDVVDVSNLFNPWLVKSFEMHHPIGLSVAEDYLFLCDDDAGLKVFDASDRTKVGDRQVGHVGIQSTDVITLPGKNLAIVIGPDGLRQFDISTPEKPSELSFIPKTK